jgi:ubiquinone/menaquinone biosynthesis C-methylase UbiE
MDRETVRADFDRIARLPGGESEDWLLEYLPRRCERGLEIGCGKGHFARELARRCRRVTAIDLSPAMLEEARKRVPDNVELVLGDAMELELADFDCAVSIATLHHLELAPMLRKLRRALKPGGVLVIHDLAECPRWAAWIGERLRKQPAGETAAAWAAHAEHDHFLKMAAIRAVARKELPGARVRRHWNWRYTLVWTA